ncbi:MAG: hypothetical protein IJ622_00335 [Bacteroidales bacterium]|nr:hypothetical protein [Bacteroidales bacterium]
MYKVSIVFLAICYMVSLSGCSSKEDRANKLIKERMSKTLYDFNSYDPIETIVSEAKATMYNDTACWNDGSLLAASMKLGLKYAEDMKDAKDYMDIWGPPSYYSSSYSDNKYYKYKNEYEDAVNSFKSTHEVCKIIVESLRNKITDLDENNIIGWEIMHKFRCKTKGGYSTIGNYRFVMDKGFNSILIVEDIDDEDDQFIRSAMETVLTDYWDK